MTEKQNKYETDADKLAENGYAKEAVEMLGQGYDQPAAVIDPPRTVQSLGGDGLADYKIWGWVKISANFIVHIKLLKGAKLAIWQTVALSIDESGECDLSVNEISNLTGYSRSEVIESLKELDGMGYLSAKKSSGRKSLYKPEFAARGVLQPSDQSRKSTGLVSTVAPAENQSSPAIEKRRPSIKRVKRVNIYPDFMNMSVSEAMQLPTIRMYHLATNYFPGSLTWELIHKTITENNLRAERIHSAAVEWRSRGFKLENIAGILDWAVNGIPENKPNINRPQKSTSPNKNDAVTKRLEEIANGE